MAGLIGKKIGMTRVFTEEGTAVPVTVVEAGPCPVVQVKTPETDGYEAVQLGFGSRKAKRAKKARLGHVAKAGLEAAPAILREFPHLCDGLLKELCHAAILARCHHVKKQQSLVAVRGRSMEVVWLKK